MGVRVTIRPHMVGKVEFDQFQILIGQRVVGYLGKKPTCYPKLVVKDLSEEAMKAIDAAAKETLGELAGQAAQQPAVGDKAKPTVVPPADAQDSAELEAAISEADTTPAG